MRTYAAPVGLAGRRSDRNPFGIPGVNTGKVDMLPTEWRDVFQQSIRNIPTRSLQLCDCTVKIDCIPVDDRADDEVETRGAI